MYAKILVPVDGSPTSDAGLVEGIRLARMGGGSVRLLHVADSLPYVPESAAYGLRVQDSSKAALEHGSLLLERCRTQVGKAGVAVDSVLVEGDGRHLEDFVAEQVNAGNADVIVLGTHGRRGLGRVLLGSDAERIVRKATVPVLLVRHPDRDDVPAARKDIGAVRPSIA